jgi:hypothetical protein
MHRREVRSAVEARDDPIRVTSTVSYLQAPFQLHDVRDVEKLACSVLDRRGAFLKGRLSPEQDSRVIAYMVECAWQYAEEKFDPRCPKCRAGEIADRKSCPKCLGSGKGASFSKLVFNLMGQRLIDWARSEFGDTRYPTNRVVLESIEHLPEAATDRERCPAPP